MPWDEILPVGCRRVRFDAAIALAVFLKLSYRKTGELRILRVAIPRAFQGTRLSIFNKEVQAHRHAKADHKGPYFPRISFLRVVRSEPTPAECAGDHYCA